MRRLFILLAAVSLLAAGCQHVSVDAEGNTRVSTFGAGTVAVNEYGEVDTTSPGLSEGISGALRYAVQAAANLLAIVLPFPAPAAPAPPPACSE